jgi:biotin operon repressor
MVAVSTRGARECIALLRGAGVRIDSTEDGEYELVYEVPLEVVLNRGKWCMSKPNQLGLSVDELFTCDDQGRTVLRGPVATASGFCLNGSEHDVYRYAELYKEIYTQITATIVGAGGSNIWNRRPKQPEDLPEEHQSQWRPVWGPAKGNMSLEAPKSLAIWVWGLLRTMPRSAAELAVELGIRRQHVGCLMVQLRKRGIPIQVRADGRYYMLDHSAIKIIWTRDGFRMARPDEKAGRSIDQLTI